MKRKTYLGFWTSNNGNTFNGAPYKDSNVTRLRKRLREAVKGNLTGPTDVGLWSITLQSEIPPYTLIASGVVRW